MFQMNTSGNDCQSTPFRKSILFLIALTIFMSLINTGLCTGPIDQIFIGWRDMTASCEFNMGCQGGDYSGGGAAILLLLSVFVGVLFFLFKTFLSLWRNLIKGAEKK